MLKTLRDIRSFRILVLHPADREREELVAQIRRIGCRVDAIWPPQNDIPSDIDIALVLFRQDAMTISLAKALADRGPGLTLVGIVEFESPSVIEAMVRAGIGAVVTKPIRAFGLLTSMIVAHTLIDKLSSFSQRVTKLEARLLSIKQIEKAKSILMSRKSMSEQDAHDFLRRRAMSKRVTMETVCAAIIEADEVLSQ